MFDSAFQKPCKCALSTKAILGQFQRLDWCNAHEPASRQRSLVDVTDGLKSQFAHFAKSQAYLWHDEQGDLDVGMFDWCGFARTSYVMQLGVSCLCRPKN